MSEIQIDICYYEHFEGRIFPIKDEIILRSLTKSIKEVADDGPGRWSMLDELGGCNSWGYWGDMDDDMKEFSKTQPNVVFCIHVRDSNDDEWETWYKNGKMDVCAMIKTFEEPDLEKLK